MCFPSVGWILTVSKTVAKIANLGKRGVLFVWKDELGTRAVGSPACSDCDGGVHASWEEAANKDSINLATGNAVVNIDSKSSNAELIKQITEGLSTAKLPCRLEFIATSEAIKWLEPELKKDFIEQGKKPVKGRLQKKKHDKLGLLAEPPLTPPPHPNLGPVIWFGNVFWHVKHLENKPYNRLGLSNPL